MVSNLYQLNTGRKENLIMIESESNYPFTSRSPTDLRNKEKEKKNITGWSGSS